MAGTIRTQLAVQAEHDVFRFNWAERCSLSQTNRGMSASACYLTETPGTIECPEISPGVVVFHNIGTTSLTWGIKVDTTFVPLGILVPGEFAMFRLVSPQPELQAQANSGDAVLQPYFFSI